MQELWERNSMDNITANFVIGRHKFPITYKKCDILKNGCIIEFNEKRDRDDWAVKMFLNCSKYIDNLTFFSKTIYLITDIPISIVKGDTV